MERSIFKFIWKNSSGQQITALLMTLASFPFLYVSLDIPKVIINEAIDSTVDEFPVGFLSFDIAFGGVSYFQFAGIPLEQLPYLFSLCGVFLALVIINGLFKLRINTFKGVMSERLLRRLRYLLLDRTMRFPLPQFQRTSQGEIVSMVAQEVEPLGGFFGDAFVLVAYQGGMFLTIMLFMFAQDPLIGLAAFAMIPVQGYIIPKLQKKVNALGKERVKHVRSLSGRISEVIGGVQDVHANDTSSYVMAEMTHRLGRIFEIRFEIFQRKFFMKFLNNFLGQLTPLFFFSIGGYLVIQGDLTIGALVAALAAYKDLAAPWKELLNYYQRMADAIIKYEAVVSQFEPQGMLDEALQLDPPESKPSLAGPVMASSVSYFNDDGVKVIDSASFDFPAGANAAFTSANGVSKEAIARLLARLILPTSGRLSIAGHDVATLHESVIGARVAALLPNPAFFNATIADNLFLGLQHAPPKDAMQSLEGAAKSSQNEALAAGNSPYPYHADWTDYAAAGFTDRDAMMKHTIKLLERFELDEDLYALGLRQVVDPERHPDLMGKVLRARTRMREVLQERGIDDLIQSYDFDLFNTYSSIGENLLFGEATDESFRLDNLGRNPVILKLLDEFKVRDEFLRVGIRCAEIMVELFQDLPPGHPFFEQYSFVDEDLLPDYKAIVRRTAQDGLGSLSNDERDLVLSLPFKLIPQRHRLGLWDDESRLVIVKMRHRLHESHPELFEGQIQKYDPEGYNHGLSILDNILFGRIVHGRADASDKTLEAMTGVVEELDLWNDIIGAAFDFPVGIGGGRLSTAQRQKIAIVRAVLKRPDVIVLNESLAALDAETRQRIVGKILTALPEATFISVDSHRLPGVDYDVSYEIVNGRVVSSDDETAVEAARRPEPLTAAEEEAEDTALGEETKLLRELPLFANLDVSKLRFLAFTSDRKSYEPGELVVKQGDQGDAAFVLLSGEAEVVLENDQGEDTVLYVMSPGQLVGELAMLCDTPRSATVRARTPLTALKLNREVFVEMARQDPFFSFEMTRDLGSRLVRTTEELNAARH
ncbi:MAG: ABC transporter transmembrane domain-containing protein [Alphaproteobacteria bacterium]|nr:ABC transporter transmembrane domain-containing protein [Alphaproteobacteria bacterium]